MTAPQAACVWVDPRPEVAAALGPLLATLAKGELPADAEPIKKSSVRAVHRAVVAGLGEVFVKRDRPRGAIERLRYLVRRPRALAEAESLARVRALSVPAAEPLAVLIARSPLGLLRESVLVTRSLGACRPLYAVLGEGAADPAVRARGLALVREAAAHVRRMHDAGLWHRDLHLGNVVALAEPDRRALEGGRGPQADESTRAASVAFIDLQKMARLPGRGLLWRLRVRDLAMLVDQPEAHERAALVEAYALGGEGARALGAPLEALLRAVERRVERARRIRRASRARRAVVSSTAFRVEARPGRRIYRRTECALAEVLAAVEQHEALTANHVGAAARLGAAPPARVPAPEGAWPPPSGAVVKVDRAGAVTCQRWAGVEPGPTAAAPAPVPVPSIVAVKSFPPRGPLGGLLRGLVHLVERHRGMRAWRGAHALFVHGVPTPQGLALVERRRLGLVLGSWLITAWQGGALDAAAFARRRLSGAPAEVRGPGAAPPLTPAEERAWMRALASTLARLHKGGFRHRDLKPPNLLVVERAPAAAVAAGAATDAATQSFEVQVVDLDALTAGPLTRARRLENLAQLEDFASAFLPWVRRTHRARFLRAYLAEAPALGCTRSALIAEVRERVAERAARRARARAGRDGPFGD